MYKGSWRIPPGRLVPHSHLWMFSVCCEDRGEARPSYQEMMGWNRGPQAADSGKGILPLAGGRRKGLRSGAGSLLRLRSTARRRVPCESVSAWIGPVRRVGVVLDEGFGVEESLALFWPWDSIGGRLRPSPYSIKESGSGAGCRSARQEAAVAGARWGRNFCRWRACRRL